MRSIRFGGRRGLGRREVLTLVYLFTEFTLAGPVGHGFLVVGVGNSSKSRGPTRLSKRYRLARLTMHERDRLHTLLARSWQSPLAVLSIVMAGAGLDLLQRLLCSSHNPPTQPNLGPLPPFSIWLSRRTPNGTRPSWPNSCSHEPRSLQYVFQQWLLAEPRPSWDASSGLQSAIPQTSLELAEMHTHHHSSAQPSRHHHGTYTTPIPHDGSRDSRRREPRRKMCDTAPREGSSSSPLARAPPRQGRS